MVVWAFLAVAFCQAQDTTTQRPSEVQLSGIVEAYAGSSLRSSAERTRPFNGVNFPRTEQVSLNLALIQAKWQHDRARAQLGLMWGDYATFNLADEPPTLQMVYEAYAGLALDAKATLWLDAGVFASHIGYETILATDNVCLTRSFASESTPYFNSGARLMYTPRGKWRMGIHAMNGWQKFLRSNQQEGMYAVGHSLSWRSKTLELHSNSYAGASPWNQRIWRLFLNTFARIYFNKDAGMIIGVDVGGDQQDIGSDQWHSWQTYSTIVFFKPHENIRQAVRFEYFQDPQSIVRYLLQPGSGAITEVSTTIDYVGIPHAMLRGEVKYLHLSEAAFLSNSRRYPYDVQVTISVVGFF